MAHWGIAYAAGPFYNLTWREHGPVESEQAARRAFDHVRLAREAAGGASDVEQRLIEALAVRYQQPHAVTMAEFEHWDDAYAAEMRRVHYQFPHDQDVTALLVEALMMRTVRRLWDLKTGTPAPGSDVLEALGICERGIARADEAGAAPHPALLHLHIHLLEMSTTPERALRSADRLGAMCPDAGHLNHMPAHIYVLCGRYDEAKSASEKAIRADDRYLAQADAPGSYYLLACGHDLHLMMYEQVYRDDLGLSGTVQRCAQHPGNVWALHGLAECLTRRGETKELPPVQDRLRAALAKTDVPISSSCLCRTSMQPAAKCCG